MTHVSNNSGNNEWYSPPMFVESARKVMGGIDTDPATSEIANSRVNAWLYYTESTDGRTKPWIGKVWMNPPYAQPLIFDFCDGVSNRYANGEIECAIVLTNNGTDTKWFHSMMVNASAVCLVKGRIKFIAPDGTYGKTPLQGQTITYFGNNIDAFIEEFSQYGKCVEC
jgi:ParB family chromosome partitioning protein